MTNAVLESLKEENQNADVTVTVCNGAAECKKALLMLQAGRLKTDFIEGMDLCRRLCRRSEQTQI